MSIPHPIQIPNPEKFIPRDYQLPFWKSITEDGVKRALLVWHRRAGKDWTALNALAKLMLVDYWHLPSTYIYLAGKSQRHGAGIIWDNRTNEGLSYLDAFPTELIERTDARNYTIYFKNGSIFKVMTTVDKEAARGMNPRGVVFSEYDYIDRGPYIWTSVFLPILMANGGFAFFTTTPQGVKQTYRLYTNNHNNPDWFMEIRDVENTVHNGKRVVSDKDIIQAKADGMSEAQIQQEFYCDFFAESGGTFYEKEFKSIRLEKRITDVPYDPALPVHTLWDLGISDSMAIWFVQVDHLGNWRWIDYLHGTGHGIQYYVRELQKKPYVYGMHVAPHDIKARELTTGQTRLEAALAFGIRFQVAPKLAFMDGVNAMRNLLARSYFDAVKTMDGTEGLKHYKKRESPLVSQFGDTMYTDDPVHDWASHPADAARTGAVCRALIEGGNTFTSTITQPSKLQTHANCHYDILGY